MTALYELAGKYITMEEYANELLDKEEDITEEDLQMLIDNLEAIEDSMEIKYANTSRFIKNLEGSITTYKTEEERLNKRRKTMENTAKWLKHYMQSMMELTGKEKIKTDLFNIRLQKNPPSVQILNEKLIPEKFREKQPDKILNKAILEALKNEESVEGAIIAPPKKHIRIT